MNIPLEKTVSVKELQDIRESLAWISPLLVNVERRLTVNLETLNLMLKPVTLLTNSAANHSSEPSSTPQDQCTLPT